MNDMFKVFKIGYCVGMMLISIFFVQMGDSEVPINLRFHHRGLFVKDPDLTYKDEELAELWHPDRDKLHFMKIERFVRSLGYSHIPQIYWFQHQRRRNLRAFYNARVTP